MHSTVQTGLYTPNIFGYDYNYHNHPPPLNSTGNHYPPKPANYHPNKSSSHHNLNHQLAKHMPFASASSPSHHHNHNHNKNQHPHPQYPPTPKMMSTVGNLKRNMLSSSSVNASLLAISTAKDCCDDKNSIMSDMEIHPNNKLSGMHNLASPKRFSRSSSNLDRMIKDKKQQKKISPLAAINPSIQLENANTKNSTSSLCSSLKQSDNNHDKNNCRKCSMIDSAGSIINHSTSNLSNQLLNCKKSNSLNCLNVNNNNNNNNGKIKLASCDNSSGSSSQISYRNNSLVTPSAILTTGGSLAMKKSLSSNQIGSDGCSGGGGGMNVLRNKGFQSSALTVKNFKKFWECTQPCGFLTLIFGFLMLIYGIIGLTLTLESSLCEKYDLCGNEYLTVSAVSASVIGIVLILIGLIIVVYSKKDQNTHVIVTSSKHIENINFDQLISTVNNTNHHLGNHDYKSTNFQSSSWCNLSNNNNNADQISTANPFNTKLKKAISTESSNTCIKNNEEQQHLLIRDENEYNNQDYVIYQRQQKSQSHISSVMPRASLTGVLIKISVNDKDIDVADDDDNDHLKTKDERSEN